MYVIAGALISSIDDLAFSINVNTEFASLIVLPLADDLEGRSFPAQLMTKLPFFITNVTCHPYRKGFRS